MSKHLYLKSGLLLVALLLSFTAARAHAQIPFETIAAIWKKTTAPTIALSMVDQITPKQLSLINSGFSTFSVLEARTMEEDAKDRPQFFKVACSIRFDTWQEVYDISKLEKDLVVTKIKNLDPYYNVCLTAEISDSAFTEKYLSEGGNILVRLLIDQLPAGRASEIKNWLIHQQSGVMQGLFGHMLGDLKLTERTTIAVKVPPLRQISTKDEGRVVR